ncbi:sulfur carrier protein ThiS [Panacagrimonas perspica]|uniref:Sulfur carrier protein ThiS n=1 Tax=Panacagrimonas perspica TaxID=381431 RepID=A0A4S3K777_9GAMM|nr:sulfur carrier protein ThiS [Panacagrimonas perspica]TDU26693.1 sulfur carrier protein ThiS [Panacagrimonas perspica]THD04040.1 thiamine biosynthesis protein ThiS [Panacagrimonas perspica]
MQLLVNGAALDLPDGASVSTLIERMQLAGKRLAVEINGEIVTRSAHADTQLREADRVEIVQAIGGG